PPQRIPTDLDAQTGLYRSQIAGKRMLVVLDNARDAAQVRPLLPGASTALAVVTSRNQLTALVATDAPPPLPLGVLTVAEAHDLLAHRLGAERGAAEPDARAQIIAARAPLPLALAIAAARAQQTNFPLADLADDLADDLGQAGRRLDALDAGDPTTQVRAVFSWSYAALTPPAARLFRLLGPHPGPHISTPPAATLPGHPLRETTRLLTELASANLITQHTPGRYTLHDLLRAYATDLAHTHDTNPQRHAATHRLLDHYLHTAYTADRLLNPARDPITLTPPQPGVTPEHPAHHRQALDWFTAEHPVLLATINHAATTGFDTHTWQLTWTMVHFLFWRGPCRPGPRSPHPRPRVHHARPPRRRSHRAQPGPRTGHPGRRPDAAGPNPRGPGPGVGAAWPPHRGPPPRPTGSPLVPGHRPPGRAGARPQRRRQEPRPGRRLPTSPHRLPTSPHPAQGPR